MSLSNRRYIIIYSFCQLLQCRIVAVALNRWIKEELVVDFNVNSCKSRAEFENLLCEYVTFYNERRPCFAIGYETPVNFRENYYNKSVKC